MPARRPLLAALLGAPALAPATARAQRQDPRTLRFVPQANLTSLDPMWSTAIVTSNHGYYVYDTLFALDAQGRVQPQMAEGHEVSPDGLIWRIRLREGLTFHDGSPVRSVDCAASLRRWCSRDGFGQTLAARVAEWATPDDRTLEIRLSRRFPLVLEVLGKAYVSVPFIMPERLARTDPSTAVTEMVGSGPYRFSAGEYVSGSRVVYTKFDGYKPRSEPASWGSGGKIAHFPRVEWHVIPDAATVAAALRQGEVDWWEFPQVDLLPTLARDRNIALEVIDPTGLMLLMRMNHLNPPFNNPRLRAAIQMAVAQEDYLRSTAGDDPTGWRACASLFPCGGPYQTTTGDGVARMTGRRDLDAARAAIRASGYAGEKITIINPADFPLLAPLGRVSHDLFTRLGLNSDLVETDWGSVIQRRINRAPVEAGGWSVLHTFGPGGVFSNPAINLTVRGQGATGWPGWYGSAAVEEQVNAWLDAPDATAQATAAQNAGRIAMDDVSTVPLGMLVPRTALRRSLTGLLPGAAPYPWGIRRA